MILNTKIQHINFEPGEFVDIKKRTYEETISCIDNFHWENERDHLQISLTNPSVTIESDINNFLKFGVFYNGKFVLHYFNGYKELYTKRLKSLGLSKYSIQFYQMNITKSEMDKLSSNMTESILKSIEMQNSRYKDSLDQMYRNIDQGLVFAEVRAFYPNIFALGVSTVEMKNYKRTDTVWTAYLQWDTLSGKVNKNEAASSIQQYLKKRLRTDTVWLQQTAQQRAKK